MTRRIASTLLALSILGTARLASAQAFPPDTEWSPLYCGDQRMRDDLRDVVGAEGPMDVVGDDARPAGLRSVDDDFLYLRLRVDGDPTTGSAFSPDMAWGMAFDLDEDFESYELLAVIDGTSGEVRLYENTDITVANSPRDPADEPALASFPASTHAQATILPNPFNDDDDFAIDLALPWTELEPAGLGPTTPIRVWAGTSSVPNLLDGDLACHDGSGGEPGLSDTHSDPTVADDEADSDGDGYSDADEVAGGSDPGDPDSVPVAGDVRLEGGGGCAVSDRGAPALVALVLAALALGMRRRRRRAAVRR